MIIQHILSGRTRKCLLLCVSAVLLVYVQVRSVASDDCARTDPLCGPRSLLVVCQKLGVEANLEELTRLCGYDEKMGATLLGLQNAAKAKGLEALAMKASLEELVGANATAVAHLWVNHFVVVEAGDSDTVKVTGSSGNTNAIKREDFKKLYSGFALLIARDASGFPVAKGEGPDLRMDSYMWDFGSVYEGDTTEHSFKCRNVGSTDLVISNVEMSCADCLVPVGGPQTIPPGGEGKIKALVFTANQRRGVARKLFVSSNDPVTRVVHLLATGYVRPARLLFSPVAINFGDPRRTEKVSAEVYVPSFDEDKIEVTSVTSSTPYVTAELSPSKCKDRPGYFVTATLKPGAPVGELKGQITITSDHPKQPNAELPVTATIRSSIALDRDSFFLGLLKKGQTRSAAVIVSRVAKDPLRISKIDNPLDHLTVDVVPKVDGKEYVLTATLKADTPVGNVKGDIVVHTSDPDQPEIKIPVFAYVEE